MVPAALIFRLVNNRKMKKLVSLAVVSVEQGKKLLGIADTVVESIDGGLYPRNYGYLLSVDGHSIYFESRERVPFENPNPAVKSESIEIPTGFAGR